jgi:hypothetical protein
MAKKVAISTQPATKVLPATAAQWVDNVPDNAKAMKRLTIDLPESLHKRIKATCAARGVKMADEIRRLLEEHFSEQSLQI